MSKNNNKIDRNGGRCLKGIKLKSYRRDGLVTKLQ